LPSSNKAISVLVIDDSAVFREILVRGLSSNDTIHIVGAAKDAYEARDIIIATLPQVLVCDVEMPKMNGIEFVKQLIPQYAVPVIVTSALSHNVFEAMNAGAVDFISKPALHSVNGVKAFILELIQKIKDASKAKLPSNPASFTNKFATSPTSTSFASSASSATLSGTSISSTLSNLSASSASSASSSSSASSASSASVKYKGSVQVIAVGASMGGVQALHFLLQQLPTDLPGIVVVQHIPAGFSNMFAERLNMSTRFDVREAKQGDIVKPGQVLIAPGGKHIRVKKRDEAYIIECFAGDKISGHCPSADLLFESVATSVGGAALGVILTGMGYDGARGLLALRRKGGKTIGQDEDSSIIYGMPKVAFELGAVQIQTSLSKMSEQIVSMVRK
jgi:two-component system chemotaxis response regulator CheB